MAPSMRGPRLLRRERIAALIHVGLLAGCLLAVLVMPPGGASGGLSVLIVIAGFAISSEVMARQLGGTDRGDGSTTTWVITSSAPHVLAILLLEPGAAVAVALVSLIPSAIQHRTNRGDLLANLANYATFTVVGVLVARLLENALQLQPQDPLYGLVVLVVSAEVLLTSFFLNAVHGAVAYSEPVAQWRSARWRVQASIDAPIALLTASTAYLYATAGPGALVVLVAVQLVFQLLAGELLRSRTRRDELERRAAELGQLHVDLAEHANQIQMLSASRGRLVGQILAAEETERRRLAEALHDEALQNLYVARQDLAGLHADAHATRAGRAVAATITQLREAIFDLHPAVLEHSGLENALQAIATHHGRAANFESHVLVASNAVGPWDSLLFSVCRELVANATKHARATRLEISVRKTSSAVELVVVDNGVGFDPSARPGVAEGHLGLASSSERVEAVGGDFVVDSAVGCGTRVVVSLPAFRAVATLRGRRTSQRRRYTRLGAVSGR